MRISLNDVAPVLPWNLEIEVQGVFYKIRPWELRDTQMISQMGALPEQDGYDWILSLFQGDQVPDVKAWDEDTASRFLATVLGYKRAFSEKKAQMVAEQVRRMAIRQ